MNNRLAFTKDTRMAEVIHRDYRLIPILARFGIKLGFGNKTVSEIGEELNINLDFFLAVVNSYYNQAYYPETANENFSVQDVIGYLSITHAHYLDSKLPQIERYIDEMGLGSSQDNMKSLKLITHFFSEYRLEIEEHFKLEEQVVFPYVLSLEEVLFTGNCHNSLVEKIKKCPIEVYERNHDNLELKLGDMKNLIIRFLPPVFNEELCERLLSELFRMELDLEGHARIEEKILVPKVKLLERKVLDICGVF